MIVFGMIPCDFNKHGPFFWRREGSSKGRRKLLKISSMPFFFPFDITIRDIEVRTGAKMLVALAGDMLLMPGLGKAPAANKMKIDENLVIEGLF